MNAELSAKNEALAVTNDDLRNLLDSSKIPTLFLDKSLRLKRFTSEARRVAKLIATDVGRPMTDIALRVDYDDLARDVAEVIESRREGRAEVRRRRKSGARYTMRIHPYRTVDDVIDGVVVTFFDVTALRRAEEALAARAHDDPAKRG